MKKKIAKQLRQRKRKIRNRLDKRTIPEHLGPMLNPGNIHYEISDRSHGVLYGGMGAVQMLVKRLGLDEAINRHLRLFKLHNPYFESDHVLNIAYNILCNGECLEDIERLRNDDVYLDAVGADRIPDPTTAGDFCRRFAVEHVEVLQEIINEIRLKVWSQQGGIILLDGRLYGYAPSQNRSKPWMCIDFKSGDTIFQDSPVRSSYKYKNGCLTYADGMFYLYSDNGNMALAKPTNTGFKVTGRLRIEDPGTRPTWAHPVVFGGRLYIRYGDKLAVYHVARRDK